MPAIKKPADIIKQDVLNIFEMHSELPEPLRNAHLFITGGTGFLGTWLLELICGLNDEFDFKIRVTTPTRSLEKFAAKCPHLAKRKEFTFIQSDIRHIVELPHDTTHIIHTAAITNKNNFATFPTAAFENNVDCTLQVFRTALQLGEIQNLLLLSSSLVYGKQPADSVPIKEEATGEVSPAFNIDTIYAESKRACESAAAAYLTEMKLPISIARPFSFVGPYQSLGLPWAVTDFMNEALKGSPIKIMSDGSVVRSIMYASDFANWILHMTAYAKPRSVYNVGSHHAIDLLSLANMISNSVDSRPKVMTNMGNNNIKPDRKVVPDISKASKELNLKVTVDLETAIQRTMQWHTMNSSK